MPNRGTFASGQRSATPGGERYFGGMHTLRWLAGLVAALSAGATWAAPSKADTTVAATERATQVAAASNVVLFSAWDDAAKQYRLRQLSGGQLADVPVPPSPEPFQADVGPTPSGHAYYVYVRCTSQAGSCDLYTFNPKTGVELRSAASDANHSDVHPTYWKGRLAFVREYGSDAKPKQIVYQRPNGNTSRSLRLPGLPSRRCVEDRCLDPQGDFTGLELYGEHLAQSARSVQPVNSAIAGSPPQVSPINQVELRLVDVDSGRSQQLATAGTGEGGQSWTGLVFDGGRLYTSFACLGDPSGCNSVKAGLYRYAYADGRWGLDASTQTIYGLGVDTGHFFELHDADSPSSSAGQCNQGSAGPAGEARCHLDRLEPAPSFTPIDHP